MIRNKWSEFSDLDLIRLLNSEILYSRANGDIGIPKEFRHFMLTVSRIETDTGEFIGGADDWLDIVEYAKELAWKRGLPTAPLAKLASCGMIIYTENTEFDEIIIKPDNSYAVLANDTGDERTVIARHNRFPELYYFGDLREDINVRPISAKTLYELLVWTNTTTRQISIYTKNEKGEQIPLTYDHLRELIDDSHKTGKLMM